MYEPYWTQPLPPYPEPNLEDGVEWVSNSRMSSSAKEKLWNTLRLENPELADLLSDPFFKALAVDFDADIAIPETAIPIALRTTKDGL